MSKFKNWIIKKCGGYTAEEYKEKVEKLADAHEEVELLRKELKTAEQEITNNTRFVSFSMHPCFKIESNYTVNTLNQGPEVLKLHLEHKDCIQHYLAQNLYDQVKKYITYTEEAKYDTYEFKARLLIGGDI